MFATATPASKIDSFIHLNHSQGHCGSGAYLGNAGHELAIWPVWDYLNSGFSVKEQGIYHRPTTNNNAETP